MTEIVDLNLLALHPPVAGGGRTCCYSIRTGTRRWRPRWMYLTRMGWDG